MLRSLAITVLVLAFASPAHAARNYRQTDTAGAQCTQTEAAACSSGAEGDTAAGREADEGGTAGTSETTYIMANGDPLELCYFYESDDVNDTSWAAGDWVIRINVTTADSQTIGALHVCRVSSDCATVHDTVASDTSPAANDMSSTGVLTNTLSGSSQTANAADLFLVTVACNETQAHGNSTTGVTPDQLIDTPLDALTVTSRRKRHNPVTF